MPCITISWRMARKRSQRKGYAAGRPGGVGGRTEREVEHGAPQHGQGPHLAGLHVPLRAAELGAPGEEGGGGMRGV